MTGLPAFRENPTVYEMLTLEKCWANKAEAEYVRLILP